MPRLIPIPIDELKAALEKYDGCQQRTALHFGVSQSTISRKLREAQLVEPRKIATHNRGKGRYVSMANGCRALTSAKNTFLRSRGELCKALQSLTTAEAKMFSDRAEMAVKWREDDEHKHNGIVYAKHNIIMALSVIDALVKPDVSKVYESIINGTASKDVEP